VLPESGCGKGAQQNFRKMRQDAKTVKKNDCLTGMIVTKLQGKTSLFNILQFNCGGKKM
jgi:hypothetical protein